MLNRLAHDPPAGAKRFQTSTRGRREGFTRIRRRDASDSDRSGPILTCPWRKLVHPFSRFACESADFSLIAAPFLVEKWSYRPVITKWQFPLVDLHNRRGALGRAGCLGEEECFHAEAACRPVLFLCAPIVLASPTLDLFASPILIAWSRDSCSRSLPAPANAARASCAEEGARIKPSRLKPPRSCRSRR